MIYGIGSDLVRRSRIARVCERHGELFAHRLLAPCEMPLYLAGGKKADFLAKRFAAKEAIAKALGTGLRHPVQLRQMAILPDSLGRPTVHVEPPLQSWLAERQIVRLHISLSDEGDWVQAFALAEQGSQTSSGSLCHTLRAT